MPILTCLFGNDDSGWATFCYWETKCHFCFNCNNLQTSQITWAFQIGTVYFCTSRGYKVIDQKRVINPTRIWTQTCRRQRISSCKMLVERSHHSQKVKYKLVQTLVVLDCYFMYVFGSESVCINGSVLLYRIILLL